MRTLVTGAAGRVGTAKCEALLTLGHTVVGYDRRPARISHDAFTGITRSLEDATALREACIGVDAVLHISAFMSWAPGDRERLFNANVTGTLNALAAAVADRVGRFIFASTGEVYPDRSPAYLPINEEHPRRPTSPYGLSKPMAEQAVEFHHRCHGLETVILRFSPCDRVARPEQLLLWAALLPESQGPPAARLRQHRHGAPAGALGHGREQARGELQRRRPPLPHGHLRYPRHRPGCHPGTHVGGGGG